MFCTFKSILGPILFTRCFNNHGSPSLSHDAWVSWNEQCFSVFLGFCFLESIFLGFLLVVKHFFGSFRNTQLQWFLSVGLSSPSPGTGTDAVPDRPNVSYQLLSLWICYSGPHNWIFFGPDDLLLLQEYLTNVKALSFWQRFSFRTPNQHDLNKLQQRVCLDYGWAHTLTSTMSGLCLNHQSDT